VAPQEAGHSEVSLAKMAEGLALLSEGLRALAEQEARREAEAKAKPTEAGDVIGVREFARMTGDSPRAVQGWIKAGVIRAERHGRLWRIERAEVERFRRRGRMRIACLKPERWTAAS